jgi:hypothetical protein
LEQAMTEQEIRSLMSECGFGISNLCCAVTHDRAFFEYDLVLKTRRDENMARLCERLSQNEAVREYRIAPTGD